MCRLRPCFKKSSQWFFERKQWGNFKETNGIIRYKKQNRRDNYPKKIISSSNLTIGTFDGRNQPDSFNSKNSILNIAKPPK